MNFIPRHIGPSDADVAAMLDLLGYTSLDEGTAAAEAMAMSYAVKGKEGEAGKGGKNTYFISDECHPQTIDVVKTRAHVRGVEVVVGNWRTAKLGAEVFGALVQYPATDG